MTQIRTIWAVVGKVYDIHPKSRNPFCLPHAGNRWGDKFEVKHFGRYLRKYKKFTEGAK
jgi:hypothetical protein